MVFGGLGELVGVCRGPIKGNEGLQWCLQWGQWGYSL